MAATLEQRIASALSDDIISTDLATLIQETEAAVADADKTAEETRERALDPTVADISTARREMEDAAFTRDRLNAALPKLRTRHSEVVAAEAYARWLPWFDDVAAEQVALLLELAELYRPFAVELPKLLLRLEANAKAAYAVNARRPTTAPGDGRYLGKDERAERIIRDLKLPSWSQPGAMAWPPPRPVI